MPGEIESLKLRVRALELRPEGAQGPPGNPGPVGPPGPTGPTNGVRSGQEVVTTNGSGDVSVYFNPPFKAGAPVVALAANADPNSGLNIMPTAFATYTDSTRASWRVSYTNTGAALGNAASIRIFWIAQGTEA